jgi:tetratricopeptide (TPR) repeat protein
MMGRALIHLKKFDKAAEALQGAINAGVGQPMGRRAALELGDLEVGQKRYRKALQAYRLASQSAEPSVAVQGYYGAARMLEATGERQAAVAAYLKVPYLYPDYRSLAAKATLAAAEGYEALGRRKEALALYKKIFAEYPKAPEAAEARASLKAAGITVGEER